MVSFGKKKTTQGVKRILLLLEEALKDLSKYLDEA